LESVKLYFALFRLSQGKFLVPGLEATSYPLIPQFKRGLEMGQ
jgi:hypothetical protein